MYIATDIGGTKFRVARSENLRDFDEPVIKETPDSPEEGLKAISETIREVAKGDHIDGIVIGIAGVLNADHSFLLKSPHLPEWERVNLREYFENELSAEGEGSLDTGTKTKVYIENDTDIVGLGEAMAGAGRGFEIAVYITISTGIGGVKVVDGKFEKNRYGFEPGHQILNNETKENWEDLASGTAVEEKHGMHPKEVAKLPVWDQVENDVAVGLHNSILHWSPDVVVVGGSMARDFDADRLKEKVSNLMQIHPDVPEIRIAELGSIGGIHGGFAYLRGME